VGLGVAELRSRGVTVDLAPDVDLGGQPANAVIGDRSYGTDPAVVVRYAAAFAGGLREGGVLPVLKHFPGHGRANGDSHRGLPNHKTGSASDGEFAVVGRTPDR
jgi:beta-N-acetylhexosaminidase